jgi:hypothetical protein
LYGFERSESVSGCSPLSSVKVHWTQRKVFGREEGKLMESGLFWHAVEGRNVAIIVCGFEFWFSMGMVALV